MLTPTPSRAAQAPSAAPAPGAPVTPIGVTVYRLHHYACFCHDAEQTRHFYEDLLGLPLVHALRVENLPGSGAYQPYLHLFFEMADGSTLAFFDLLGGANHPGMTAPHPWTNHVAMRVSSMEQLMLAKERLEAAGVAVRGPLDHEFVQSIYFSDPNGVNLEFTTDSADAAYLQHERDAAHAHLAAWMQEKQRPLNTDTTQ